LKSITYEILEGMAALLRSTKSALCTNLVIAAAIAAGVFSVAAVSKDA
jgi:hypothetical protein